MSIQVYSVPGQTEVRRKAFLERTSIDLSSILYLKCGVMFATIKVFIILLLLCLWEQGKPWQFSKQISKLFFRLSVKVHSFLGQTEKERKAFFGGCKRMVALWDYLQKHLVVIKDEKVCPYVKLKSSYPSFFAFYDQLQISIAGHGTLR